MAESDRTRAKCVRTLAAMHRESNRARGKAEAEREEVKEEHKEQRYLKQVSQSILRHLTKLRDEQGIDAWLTHAKLRRKITEDKREHFEDAAGHLDKSGQIEVEEIEGQGTKGKRYRLAVK